jgi:sulfate permease, SulP family
LLKLPGLQTLLCYQSAWLRGDLLAGITVAAYLIPQCMAYGEIAGLPPVAGLWAILPPLFIYAFLGSSRQLSVGPESGTALLTAATIAPFVVTGGNYAGLAALLATMVGIICLVGYVTRLGYLANLLSKPILVGYMAGVSIIMIAGQLSNITKVPLVAVTVWGTFYELMSKYSQIHLPTLLLALGVLGFLYGCQWLVPKAPAPLLAVLLATIAVVIGQLDRAGVQVVGTIPAGLPSLAWPPITLENIQMLTVAALGIALVGYSDNVLTARAFASRNGYQVDANQELLALGFCNLGNGLMQGFPISSSGSRTAIGESLGSKTQLFSVVAFIVVILVLLFLRPVLALFPKAALGAIVIYAGSRLIDIPEFVRLYRFRLSELGLALITSLGVIFTDIVTGVIVAVLLSLLEFAIRVAHFRLTATEPQTSNTSDDHVPRLPGMIIYRQAAPLFFANADKFKCQVLAAITETAPPVKYVVLDAAGIGVVDITAIEMLEDLQDELTNQGIILSLVDVQPRILAELQRAGFIDRLGNTQFFPTMQAFVKLKQASPSTTI